LTSFFGLTGTLGFAAEFEDEVAIEGGAAAAAALSRAAVLAASCLH
jgi:hypothetical protein